MRRIIFIAITALLLAGCGDTRVAIEEMNRKTSEARAAGAKALAQRLKADPNISGQGDIQIFMSSDLIRQMLGVFSGFAFNLEQQPDVKITFVAAAPQLSEGVAAVDIKLQAARGDLKFDIAGVATLLPLPLEPGRMEVKMVPVRIFGLTLGSYPEFKFIKPGPMKFRLVVERLAPHASWGPFSQDLKGFVSEFARMKINEDLAKKIPEIVVPIDNLIKINQPAQTKEFGFAKDAYMAGLTTPPVSWAVTFGLKEFIVLPRGIHLIGTFNNPGSTR